MSVNENILNRNGWTVDCYSPFEISNQAGDMASGEAAYLVMYYLEGAHGRDPDDCEEDEYEEELDDEEYLDDEEDLD